MLRENASRDYYDGVRDGFSAGFQVGGLSGDLQVAATVAAAGDVNAAEARAQASEERWHREQQVQDSARRMGRLCEDDAEVLPADVLARLDRLHREHRHDRARLQGFTTEPVEADPAKMERLCREQPQGEEGGGSAAELMEMQESAELDQAVERCLDRRPL